MRMSAKSLPKPLQHNWAWQFQASCRDSDAQVFFHPPGERGTERRARDQAAKQICLRCPVRDPCLRFALEAREPYSVWGGQTERERLVRTDPGGGTVVVSARRTPGGESPAAVAAEARSVLTPWS
jgi:WhiB family redox-sensing transcriptional regulator